MVRHEGSSLCLARPGGELEALSRAAFRFSRATCPAGGDVGLREDGRLGAGSLLSRETSYVEFTPAGTRCQVGERAPPVRAIQAEVSSMQCATCRSKHLREH